MKQQNNKTQKQAVLVVVNMQSKHISQQGLYDITLSLVDKTRQEPACLEYNCYSSIDDDSVMEVILFENVDGHQTHMNSPHVLAFQAKYQALDLQYAVQRVGYTQN
ncbi:hypothetical protein TUM4261_08960 [Shewanella sp. c952]|uniref:putative quinol monooxygenase n=1 Tax=Shewanella sp. c952 TaxID=2815913 RepID=UPI001BBA3FEF|nr:antibiotic biosynthesis monooxygenase [Shewanella sp. c952]GIU06090.1 hypothetical protein TUM4261_08960 [Shewanella sp. c952]